MSNTDSSHKITPSAFSIRKAGPEDAPLIMDFITKLAIYEKLEDQVTANEQKLHEALFGAEKFAEVIFGFEQETPVGFALYFHNFSTFLAKPGLYLEDLFVLEKYRGKGYGLAMMKYLAKLAKKRDCGRFEWSVLNWNEPAIKFYEKLGAEPMDGWTVYRLSGSDLDDIAED